METKAVIFDLYGTLVDIWTDEFKPELWKAMAELYSVYGADYTPEEFHKEYLRLCAEKEKKLGGSYPEIELREVFSDLLRTDRKVSISAGEDFVEMAANIFRIISRNRLGLMPNALSTLYLLRANGYKLCLLSNAQSVFTVPEMEKLGIYNLFDDIYISSDRRIKKPDPNFMRMLLSEHNLKPEECVMVGNDFSTDMRVAAACGVRGVFLNSDRHSEEELFRNLRLFPRNSITVIEDLSEIII